MLLCWLHTRGLGNRNHKGGFKQDRWLAEKLVYLAAGAAGAAACAPGAVVDASATLSGLLSTGAAARGSMSRKKALLCCLPPTFIVPFNLPDASQPASTQHTEVQSATSNGYHIPDSPNTAKVLGMRTTLTA